MSGTYDKVFISKPQVSLIGAVGAADQAAFSMQTALWFQGLGNPDLAAKWKRSALRSLKELEQAVTEMRKEVEALPDESTLHPA